MDFILSKIISRPRSAVVMDPKGCEVNGRVESGKSVEAPQKLQQLDLRPEEFGDLQPTSENFIDNLHPEATLAEQEREGKSPCSEDHPREGGSYCSALSSDDETFVECHSYIGDQTINNPDVLSATVDLISHHAEEQLSSTFNSGVAEIQSPGKNDVNLIAAEFVEEIVSKALSILPPVNGEHHEIDKSFVLPPSREESVHGTPVGGNSTEIIGKTISIDDEILQLTESLSKFKIPQQSEEVEEFSPCDLDGTFDVSMKSVENLNGTIVLTDEVSSSDCVNNSVVNSESPAIAPVAELCVKIAEAPKEEVQSEKEDIMPETLEINVSRNGSFDESPARDSPKTPTVTSSVCNITNQPDSATPPPPPTFVENLITENVDFAFKVPEVPASSGDGATKKKPFGKGQEIPDEIAFSDIDFQPGNEFEFTESHFDYLLTKGNNCRDPIDRSSLLLRFDPLLNQPVPALSHHNRASLARQHKESALAEVTEEEEQELRCCSEEFGVDTPNLDDTVAPCMSENDDLGCVVVVNNSENSPIATTSCEYAKDLNSESDSYKDCLSHASSDATMSVDIIKEVATDEVKSVVNINSEDSFRKEYKMAELEKKIKNEVLKTEDIEKKLKDAEAREESLLKRLTENQKNITKMAGVLEAYEKTIAELIAEKQQLIESYDKKCSDLQNERDVNFQHLTSLEATFTDLHAKYERSKQITTALKKSEENLMAEKKQCHENLQLQEQRYEKMKSHAMQQLELANGKLDVIQKTHAQETAKLKALLKKEEISRLSTNEQLIQKTRENEELVKICDELINGSAPTS